MAYNNQSNGSRFGNKAAAAGAPAARPSGQTQASSSAAGKKPAAILTGLFPADPEKSKAFLSVTTDIAIDLRAGQRVYIDVYKNSAEDVAAGKPEYRLRVTPAPEKKRA